MAPKARIAFSFLFPALLLLAVLVLYPILYSVKRSMFDALGTHFVGLSNYKDMFTSPDTRTAIKNNAIWVLVAPIVVTALGLIFAVLTERVKWSTAFKTVVFMPMAISFLATGIIFRLVYDADPSRGLANALISGIHDIFSNAAHYPGGRPRGTQVLTAAPGGGYQTTASVSPGGTILLPLVGVAADDLPKNAQDAIAPSARSGAVNGTVWFDFSRGGRGTPGSVDRGEKGLPGINIQALQNGKVVASAKSDGTGRFSFHNPALHTGRVRRTASAVPRAGVAVSLVLRHRSLCRPGRCAGRRRASAGRRRRRPARVAPPDPHRFDVADYVLLGPVCGAARGGLWVASRRRGRTARPSWPAGRRRAPRR